MRHSGDINKLSLAEQKMLVAEYFSQLDPEEKHMRFLVWNFGELYMPERRKHSSPDFIDTFTEALPDFYQTHPNVVQQIINCIYQHRTTNPESLLKTAAKLINHPKTDQFTKTTLISGLNYLGTFGLRHYFKEKIQELGKKTIEEEIQFLEIIALLTRMPDSYSEDFKEEMMTTLKIFSVETQNALLKRKSESLVGDHNQPALVETQQKHFIENYEKTTILQGSNPVRYFFIPISSEHIGIYNKGGRLRELLPRTTDNPSFTEEDIINPTELPTLSPTKNMGQKEKERKEQAQKDYIMLLDITLLDGIEKDFGFNIREMTTREQIWFVESLKGYTLDQEKKVQEFTKKFGIEGARTFFSAEFGDTFRKEIVSLGEVLPETEAQTLFHTYSALIQAAQDVEHSIMRQYFTAHETEHVDTEKISHALLHRAQHLLSETIQQTTASNQIDTAPVITALKDMQTNLEVFKSVCIGYLKNNPEAHIQDLHGMEYQRTAVETLQESIKETMRIIATKNWDSKGKTGEKVLEAFETHLKKQSGVDFYILRKDQQIIGFVSFEDAQDERGAYKKAGSLNIAYNMRGSAIGETVLRNILMEASKTARLEATVMPELTAGTHYVEENGFVITGIIPNFLESNTPFFCISLDVEQNKTYTTKKIPQSDIIRLYKERQSKEAANAVIIEHFSKDQHNQMVDTIDDHTKNGYHVTRYFIDPEQADARYYVCEKLDNI